MDEDVYRLHRGVKLLSSNLALGSESRLSAKSRKDCVNEEVKAGSSKNLGAKLIDGGADCQYPLISCLSFEVEEYGNGSRKRTLGNIGIYRTHGTQAGPRTLPTYVTFSD